MLDPLIGCHCERVSLCFLYSRLRDVRDSRERGAENHLHTYIQLDLCMVMPLAAGLQQNKTFNDDKWSVQVFDVFPGARLSSRLDKGQISHHNNPIDMIIYDFVLP